MFGTREARPHEPSLVARLPLVGPLALASSMLALGSLGGAQSIQALVLAGDTVPGAPGTMAGVLDVAVANDGQWISRVSMTTPSGGVETAILNGAAVLIEDDVLFDPPGLLVQRFDDMEVSPDGTIWWNIDTDAGATDDFILYRNLVQLAREGAGVQDPNAAAGTIWKDFDGFRLNTENDLLVLGDIDSPLIPSGSDPALVLQQFDDNGVLIAETIILQEDDPIPSTINDEVLDVGTNSGAHDVDHSVGHWIAYVRADSGGNNDETILVDNQLIAREGSPGPEIGSLWDSLNNNAVSINNDGDFVFRGTIQEIGGPQFDAIFLNGEQHITEGDPVDGLGVNFASFGTNTPILMSEAGDIVFYGKTDDTNTGADDGYFRNTRMLVQEGTTQVGSSSIGNLVTGPNALNFSSNGRYVIFEAFLGNGTNGVFLIDLGLAEEIEPCDPTAGTLRLSEGLPILGETVSFEIDGEQEFGVTPFFFLSADPVVGWPPCGLMTPAGELIVDLTPSLGNPAVALTGVPSDFLPQFFEVTVPNDPALLNRQFYAQGLWWDIGDMTAAENFRLTNAVEITLGPS